MRNVIAFDLWVVFEEAFAAIYVIRRTKTRELDEFAYKMGLIEISEIQGNSCPVGKGVLLDESTRLLKPLNPAE